MAGRARWRYPPGPRACKSKRLQFGEGFRVALEVRRMQAAEMLIPPADSEGGPDNRHRGADQWLFVVKGHGVASVRTTDGRKPRISLRPRRLLVIEKGEQHEVRNTGRALLRTFNFYCPPAFRRDGEAKSPSRNQGAALSASAARCDAPAMR